MDNQELRDLLEKVRQEIDQTGTIDDKDRELLSNLDSDIRRVLERQGTGKEAAEHAEEAELDGSIEQLEYSVEHFEVTHPELYGLLSHMMEILSAAGI
jgi:hypothetical protein